MKISYGNIKDILLEDVIKLAEYRTYWGISKDEISKCNVCEFRYICSDCRAYTEIDDDLYSKPLKYGYDPYTGIWNEKIDKI